MTHLTATFIGTGIAPTIVSVDAASRTTVRVIFSEVMGTSGLSTAANYTIAESMGSDPVNVTAATPNAAKTEVILTLDAPLTPGVDNYTLSVAGTLVDAAANVIDPPLDWLFSGPDLILSPDTVEDEGGYLIEAEAPGLADADYFVYLDGQRCYSAVVGQGDIIKVRSGLFTFATPPRVPGLYDIQIVGVTTIYDATFAEVITYTKHNLRYSRMSLRRGLNQKYKTGPKSAQQEPAQ